MLQRRSIANIGLANRFHRKRSSVHVDSDARFELLPDIAYISVAFPSPSAAAASEYQYCWHKFGEIDRMVLIPQKDPRFSCFLPSPSP